MSVHVLYAGLFLAVNISEEKIVK